MKNRITLSLAAILTTVSSVALADRGWRYEDDGYYDQARVVAIQPITTTVHIAVPQRECYQQEVRTPVYSRTSDGAALVGGIVGSIIGHNIGQGRRGSTVAGAIIGAAVGKSMAHGTDSYYEDVSVVNRCDVHTTYQTREQLEGYNVTYRYKGQLYTTRTDSAPGKFIRVRVAVSAVVE